MSGIPEVQERLLGGIVAHPEDDQLRLVYSDWLEENGDTDQAEFIRASLELHRHPERADLAARLEQLATAQGQAWLAAVGVPAADELDPKFHRGCVEGIECQSLRPLFDAEEILFSLFPIREVVFWWQYSWGLDAAGLVRLSEMPGLERLSKLRLANYDSELMRSTNPAKDWGEFFRCPRLAGLRTLAVDASRLTDADVAELARSPVLAGLTTLSLEQNTIGIAGVQAVLRSPYLTGLKRLSLGGNDIHEGVEEYQDLAEELERRFPGQDPLNLFREDEWFQE